MRTLPQAEALMERMRREARASRTRVADRELATDPPMVLRCLRTAGGEARWLVDRVAPIKGSALLRLLCAMPASPGEA